MLAAATSLAALLHTTIAIAADPAPDVAAQLAGLFVQGCLPFAGDSAALRAWAGKTGLSELPDQAKAAFLHGAPGLVFDASDPDGKFVLASADDGICSVITDVARTDAVSQALEGALTRLGVAFRRVIDRDDTQATALHLREYLATKDARGWRILSATVNDPAGGQAMLTAAPE